MFLSSLATTRRTRWFAITQKSFLLRDTPPRPRDRGHCQSREWSGRAVVAHRRHHLLQAV